jgi:beta-1,4-mannosyl-glycoprotein beta-1,4-N-acetylglucosaminyltransferase
MKIYDCFMYFDEDLILETRLNILDKYVDYFIIIESKFNHKGEERKLNFDLEKFNKFKDKIKYLVVDELPNNLEEIAKSDTGITKEHKFINNAVKRENSQRNFINNGLGDANEEDFILISDLDEIPCLKNIDFKQIKEKIVIFEQIMTYYKFNLALPDFKWYGTKGCIKKNLKSPQWLRNVKSKKYSLFRFDIFFNDKRYNNIRFIKNGGWHFTNIKTAEEIELKFKSYLHHREFELSGITLDNIRKIIKDKYAIYDLNVDQRSNKIGSGKQLVRIEDYDLPEYIVNNKKKISEWFD